ncbi:MULTISPECIES: DNA polymerase III subunit delta' [Micromonospora]|uniref:DNA polymerase III subunit delta n=2 Tax=Micromonospora TaxID=1873 RepID=A0A9X0I6U8_9ACTN|nr:MULTISPECIES: DNA polymerase III subunit delta' [Micromonospora]AEB42403.1 DNA polymerase III, delta prime subunit [Micromonospora maris AB-18-032]KUJ47873.1 DNA polymerase III subunit delta' [Micromonospora maris]MBL6276722.1 DNA polymerase III subunit delta' [Micromonospora fiedleri]RUL91083.1 DNA polymerase III subunit delta' [Verrucosispora sp. FIM060022]WSK43566.1 DNA polymerase III subunit delta' [Micromonospora maris]
MPDAFADLVGQDEAVDTLRRAAAAAAAVLRTPQEAVSGADPGAGMTHAWIFTGPPGSGRSVAARAFAAALQCEHGTGCGQCPGCHTTLAGTHADVRLVVPDGLSIGVNEMRALVLRAASTPSGGRWQVVIIEDADRLTEAAGNALLKAVEEPPPRTVFLLCTPSTHPDDISVTIRSRCRVVPLVQPAADAVAEVLVRRDGIAPDVARWAAAATQGHVGRARRLAGDPQARARREAVLAVPRRLTSVGAAFDAASALIEAAEAEAEAAVVEIDAAERAALETALGAGGTGRGAASAARGSAGQLKDLERRQKSRATRAQRDALDRALVDLAAFYRDALTMAMGAPVPPVHTDTAELADAGARSWQAEGALRRLEAVLACRTAIEANVKPRIAVEAMMLALWKG